MPNLKIYVDEAVLGALRPVLRDALGPVQSLLCDTLKVEPADCQLVVVPVFGLLDQPQVNLELKIMPRPERTGEVIRAAAERLQALISSVTGLHVAVRIEQLDRETYVSLK